MHADETKLEEMLTKHNYLNLLTYTFKSFFFLNPSPPPRPAKIGHFIILLCQMPNAFTHQGRALGWESVK